MFVLSVKATKKKLLAFGGTALAIAIAVAVAPVFSAKQASAYMNKNCSASDSQERIAFLSQFGWQVKEEATEVVEVIIPQEFSEVYENYNKIQLDDGFDLSDYKGKRVKRWTYQVLNYPGYEKTDLIFANLLIYEGRVIGGDICSIELSGFMHCFTKR